MLSMFTWLWFTRLYIHSLRAEAVSHSARVLASKAMPGLQGVPNKCLLSE